MPHMFESRWTRDFDFDLFTRDYAERTPEPEQANPRGHPSLAGNLSSDCDAADGYPNPTDEGQPCSH